MLNGKKIICLDVDGTLYDLNNFKKALLKLIVTKGFLHSFSSTANDIHNIYRFHRHATAARKEPCNERFERLALQSVYAKESLIRWYGESLKQIGPREGVSEFLNRSRLCSIKLVAVSDYTCDYKLKALNLNNYFDDQIVGEAMHLLKPNPGLFQHLLNKYQVQPQDVLHIGDKVNRDGKAAQKANIECLIINRDFHSFFDLCNIVGNHSA